jgi:hypothetical protein
VFQRTGFIVFALVLALLAHDTLMASDAGADASSGLHEHHAGMSAGDERPNIDLHSAAAPAHPDGCGPTMPAVSPQKPSKGGPGVSGQVASGTDRVEPVQLAIPAHPPTRPPAARRALFQVYRI